MITHYAAQFKSPYNKVDVCSPFRVLKEGRQDELQVRSSAEA